MFIWPKATCLRWRVNLLFTRQFRTVCEAAPDAGSVAYQQLRPVLDLEKKSSSATCRRLSTAADLSRPAGNRAHLSDSGRPGTQAVPLLPIFVILRPWGGRFGSHRRNQ